MQLQHKLDCWQLACQFPTLCSLSLLVFYVTTSYEDLQLPWQSYTNNMKRLSVPRSQRALALYPVTDCAAVTDISSVSGRWQLSH